MEMEMGLRSTVYSLQFIDNSYGYKSSFESLSQESVKCQHLNWNAYKKKWQRQLWQMARGFNSDSFLLQPQLQHCTACCPGTGIMWSEHWLRRPVVFRSNNLFELSARGSAQVLPRWGTVKVKFRKQWQYNIFHRVSPTCKTVWRNSQNLDFIKFIPESSILRILNLESQVSTDCANLNRSMQVFRSWMQGANNSLQSLRQCMLKLANTLECLGYSWATFVFVTPWLSPHAINVRPCPDSLRETEGMDHEIHDEWKHTLYTVPLILGIL